MIQKNIKNKIEAKITRTFKKMKRELTLVYVFLLFLVYVVMLSM
jgi:hypothetical protein